MKKTIKRVVAALACLMMIATLAACSKSGEKVYTIATDTTFAPFEFTDSNGDFVGIDVDLIKAISEDQGFKYELKSLGFNAAVTALETSQADAVIAGMSITPARQQTYNFTDPYYDSGIVMAVAANNTDIKSYADLQGKKVAVKTGTEGQEFANSIKDKYAFEIDVLENSAVMYEAVKTGTVVACFEDYPVMGYGISQGNGLKMVTEMEQGSSYGLAVMKDAGNDELIEMFNKGLANLKANGKYQEILDKYIATK